MSLALANALIAAQSGASYIDVSTLGLGRGVGNLRSELWCVNSVAQGVGNYYIGAFLSAIQEIQQYNLMTDEQDILSLVGAAYNLSPQEVDDLRKTSTLNKCSWAGCNFIE
jgi:4-hydroxy 2-oxovalerate aldolase